MPSAKLAATRREGVLSSLDVLDPKVSALIVVDVQNDYCHPKGAFGKAGLDVTEMSAVIPAIRRLITVARHAGVLIVYTLNGHSAYTDSPAWRRRGRRLRDDPALEPARTGTWGARLYRLKPIDGEYQLHKPRYDAFIGTELEFVLRARGIKTLICAGVATSVCVDSTARGGAMRDFDVVLIEDACACVDRSEHEAALRAFARYFGLVRNVTDVEAAWAPTTRHRLKRRSPGGSEQVKPS